MAYNLPPKRSDIDLLIFDFDGVMTDNRVLVFSDGTEAVFCNRGDGLGVGMLRASGLIMAIVSTERNEVVAARAAKLRLAVYQGVSDKLETVRRLLNEYGTPPRRTAFVGNDINDIPALEGVGWPLCPLDADGKVKAICRWVIPRAGGQGLVRHLADCLLSDDGNWSTGQLSR